MSDEEIDKDYLSLIVNNLLSGMDVSRVPEEYLQYVFEPLAKEKEKAIKKGRVDIVKRIQAVVKQINYLVCPPKKPTKIRSSLTNRSKQTIVPNKQNKQISYQQQKTKKDENSDLRRQLKVLTNEDVSDVSDPDMISQIIPVLKEDKENAIQHGEYHQAQVIHNMIKAFQKKTLKSALDNYETEQFYQLQNQLCEAEEELENLTNYWTDQLNSAKQSRVAQIQEMKEIHKDQINDFQSTWPKELPPSFRKVSNRVLQLREQEKHLITSNRFEAAVEYRRMADDLERQEIDRQRINFDNEFHRSLLQIKSAQKKEMDYLKQKWENRIDHMQTLYYRDIENKKRYIENLRSRLNPMGSRSNSLFARSKTPKSTNMNYNTTLDSESPEYRANRVAASKLAYRSPWKY